MLRKKSVMGHISLFIIFFFICQTVSPVAHAFDTGTGDMHGGTSTGNTNADPNKGDQDADEDPNKNDCAAADPVSLMTGEFTYTYDDFEIPGRGVGIVLTHLYKSRRDFNGRWGYGWFINYDMKIRQLENGNLLLIDESGKKNEYTKNGTTYEPPKGYEDTLVENGDGTYTRTLKNGTRYEFNANGSLVAIRDRNDNGLTFIYDDEGKLPISGKSEFFATQETGVLAYDYKLTGIEDDAGRSVSFLYNDNGRLEKMTDPEGREIAYAYDDNDNLVKITDPEGNFYSFAYDDAHHLISVTNPEGGEYLTNTYDEQGRVVEHFERGETLRFSFNEEYDEETQEIRKTATLTRGNGSVIFYELSECCGNPIQVIRDYGGMNLAWSYTYDDDMNMLSATDPRGNTTRYTYDENGNVLTVTDPYDNVTTFTYDAAFNQITSVTDALGRVTQFEYDEKGRLTKTIDGMGYSSTFTYAENGDLLTATNAEGNVTTFSYEMHGYIASVEDSLGNTIDFTYDDLGNIVSAQDKNGNTTEFEYTENNQVAKITNAFGLSRIIEYDKNGNRIKIVDTLNNEKIWQYDSYGRILSVINEMGSRWGFVYDNVGNLSKLIDPENNATQYQYDALSRLVRTIDVLGNTTSYSYDENGNLTAIEDADGNTTYYDYDKSNRLVKKIFPDGTFETYLYNQVNNLVSKTNRKGNMIAYTFDKLDRLRTISYPGVSRKVARNYPDATQISFDYDKVGRLIKAVKGSDTISYTYDAANRLMQAVQNGKAVAYEYDNAGNRIKLTYPDNSFVIYVYDALNRLDQIKDSTGQILADYSYDQVSRRTQVDLANGTRSSYQHDSAYRLTSLVNNVKSPESVISSFEYTYDKIGNRTSMTTTKGIHAYTYDKIYQLTKADYPSVHPFADTDFTYDAVMNRVKTVNGGTTDYAVNNLNQYTTVGHAAYTYDANGNLTGDGTNIYEYDLENQMYQAKTASDTVTFAYDAFGRRAYKTNDAGKTVYLYDGDQVIAEYDDAGALLRKFVYGNRIDEPILMETSSGSRYFYHADGLGSITELSDVSGAVIERYEYAAYGKLSIKNGSGVVLDESAVGNPYFFSGRRYDSDTDLYYYRTRYYSAELGRFFQVDPIGYRLNLNLYAYCLNNPINWIDPWGLKQYNLGGSVEAGLGGHGSVGGGFLWDDDGNIGIQFCGGVGVGVGAYVGGGLDVSAGSLTTGVTVGGNVEAGAQAAYLVGAGVGVNIAGGEWNTEEGGKLTGAIPGIVEGVNTKCWKKLGESFSGGARFGMGADASVGAKGCLQGAINPRQAIEDVGEAVDNATDAIVDTWDMTTTGLGYLYHEGWDLIFN